jgi:hypothetical protein
VPKEARTDLSSAECGPQPQRVGRRQLKALDQEAAGFLGAYLRRLLNVRVHDLGERHGVDGILIDGINIGSHAPHHRPDDISRQPWDPIDSEQALR